MPVSDIASHVRSDLCGVVVIRSSPPPKQKREFHAALHLHLHLHCMVSCGWCECEHNPWADHAHSALCVWRGVDCKLWKCPAWNGIGRGPSPTGVQLVALRYSSFISGNPIVFNPTVSIRLHRIHRIHPIHQSNQPYPFIAPTVYPCSWIMVGSTCIPSPPESQNDC